MRTHQFITTTHVLRYLSIRSYPLSVPSWSSHLCSISIISFYNGRSFVPRLLLPHWNGAAQHINQPPIIPRLAGTECILAPALHARNPRRRCPILGETCTSRLLSQDTSVAEPWSQVLERTGRRFLTLSSSVFLSKVNSSMQMSQVV